MRFGYQVGGFSAKLTYLMMILDVNIHDVVLNRLDIIDNLWIHITSYLINEDINL